MVIIKVKELDDPNYKKMIKFATMFDIEKIDLSYYKNLLKFYENDKLIGLVNYTLTPSMRGKDKLFIRNLYCIDNKFLNDIILSLCDYCKNKKYIIMTTNDKHITNECKEALYKNNFTGKNIILYTTYT